MDIQKYVVQLYVQYVHCIASNHMCVYQDHVATVKIVIKLKIMQYVS